MKLEEEIYSEYAKIVYTYLFSHTHDANLAEEFTQETFFRAVNNIHQYKGNSSIRTWLCGIAKNVWYEYLRNKKRKMEMPMDAENGEKIPTVSLEEEYFLRWDNVDILKQIHRLKEPMREVIYLRLIGNLSFRQIGEIMDKSENWARVTFYRGKERIIKEIEYDE
mgnify:CR=1 FL=1